MSIPKCQNPECSEPAARNAKNTGYLQHCSRTCLSACNSRKGSEKRKQTNLERYGVTCSLKHSETQEKIRQTKLERYGVEHHMKTAESKQRLRDTKLMRYGDSAFNNRDKFRQTLATVSEEVKQTVRLGRINTVREKYGVDYYTQTQDFKQKSKSSSIEKYGCDYPAQSLVVKQKITETMREKYGSHYAQQHISPDSLEKLSSCEYLDSNKHRSLLEIGAELGVTYHTVDYAYKKHGIVRTFDQYHRSLAETEILEYIQSLKFDCQQGVRDLIAPRELDLYVPAVGLAIEYDGLYWHCETSGKSKTYHLEKTQLCEQKNIRLIHITDYEWKNKKDIVKSRLSNFLGSSNKIGARTCQVVELDSKTTADFLNQTHIQGAVNASIRLGLMHKNVLVAVMTFGKSRYNPGYQYELLRFSNSLGVSVIGAASKLFKHFVEKYQPHSVVSYSDLRWNTGNMYAQLGFAHVRNTAPNYWYTRQHLTFESRVKYQKHKLEKLLSSYNSSETEWENMVRNGYDRYWDCGNSVWGWVPHENC